MPLIKTDPSVGGYKDVINEISVVFPAALCPNRAVICPLYIFRSTLLTAFTCFVPEY